MQTALYKTFKIPSSLQLSFSGSRLNISSSLDTTKRECLHIPQSVRLEKKNNNLSIYLLGKDEKSSVFVKTWVTLLQNVMRGLTRGYTLNLSLRGIGFRAQLQNNCLSLKLGHSHPDELSLEKNVAVFVNKSVSLVLRSASKVELNQYAAKIKVLRLPDVYKGKGIVKKGEELKLKIGKKK